MIAAIKSKIKYPTSNAPFGSAYEEHAAIKDTAAEVRALRKNGIHVSAVFMGNDGEVTNAKQIYGAFKSSWTSDSKRGPGVI